MTFDRILLFGYGNLASALLEGWLAAGVDPATFSVHNPRPKPVPPGVAFGTTLPTDGFDAVVLGVKPQQLAEAALKLEPLLGPGTVLISLLAGAEIATLERLFPRAGAIVRWMSNLAAAIRQSPTALAEVGLDDLQRAAIAELAARLGPAEWLPETQFDLATALVGSGPGFVYRFIDALAAGAAELGMERAMAERLAVRMVHGAAALAASSPHGPAELTRRVASPGGTTQAGLAVLDDNGTLDRLVEACLAATRDRGRELAQTPLA